MRFSKLFLLFAVPYAIALGASAVMLYERISFASVLNGALVVIFGGLVWSTRRFAKNIFLWELSAASMGLLVLGQVLGDGSGALGLSWYYDIRGYDKGMHALAGFGLGLVACALMPVRFFPAGVGVFTRYAAVLCATLGFVGAVGVGWEIFEFIAEQFVGYTVWGGMEDALFDLAADVSGACIAWGVWLWTQRVKLSA